jgi:putative salt-induced outer membrane protein
MGTRSLLMALGLLSAGPALADWAGTAEAGLVIASGNSESETANAKLKFENTLDQWKHSLGAAALYASDEDGETANRWDVFGQSDYNFTPRTFWFGSARYGEDAFSGFEYQATATTGLGRKFIDTAATKFVGTAGVGYTFFETRDAFDDAGILLEEGQSESSVVFRGTLDFEHAFTETTKLINLLAVETGADNTFVQNDLSLQVKINTVLALAVGYSVRHNTDPPAGFEETDTLTTVNLVYELK